MNEHILNKLHIGSASEFMKKYIEDNSIDLTVTSPPYDNLRDYNGYIFDFENIAKELFRVTKDRALWSGLWLMRQGIFVKV